MDQNIVHWLLEGLFGVAGFLGVTVLRGVLSDLREVTRELGLLRVHIADNYVRRDELQQQLGELGRTLRRVEDKIDRVKDRGGHPQQFPELFEHSR